MQFLRHSVMLGKFFLLFLVCTTISVSAAVSKGNNPAQSGIVKGVVRDAEGNPIAGAVVLILREGNQIVRQMRSAENGGFSARVLSGTYIMAAAALGYNAAAVENISVERSTSVVYNFNLRKSGEGNTLPERRIDRNDAKWRIRSSASQRTILQNNEGDRETIARIEAALNERKTIETAAENEDNAELWRKKDNKSENFVETFAADSANPGAPNAVGVNFATVQPLNNKISVIIAGQTSFGKNAPQRLETTAKIRATENHNISLKAAGVKINAFESNRMPANSELGQISFQAIDEWRVKEGVIVVLGFDYSRFIGAGNAANLSPRIGLQLNAKANTRLNFAYTTQSEEPTWERAAEFEDANVIFRQSQSAPIIFADAKPQLPKLRRLEFGIERVVDNKSNLEATAFFDLTQNRGIGLMNLSANNLTNEPEIFDSTVQNGSAQGVRVVYSRRLPKNVRASVGYAFGKGQKLSPKGITDPASLFVNSFFQTLAAQVSANFTDSTEIKTVLRFSPEATVFAIDPFAGRLAVYDPSLSILITQNLPRFGLPFEAKASLDARNLFDLQTATENGETSLKLNTSRRMLRGAISVRF